MDLLNGNRQGLAVVRGSEFYVTGGTLRPDAPSYVDREADRDLWRRLLEGEFCYVLTSRQMGKSSLMVRTVKRLRDEGVSVAVLDLTAIGQNLTIDQWYDGLISRLGQQLDLEDELLEFWEAHPELGPLQRWVTALEKVVLEKITTRVVIFVDEIDIVRSLPFSTDEFFAAIREAYNRRSREPMFNRLAFGLLGVAAPTDLIRDTRMTPFNIGHRIELHDFTSEEAAPLARGLGPDAETAQGLLQRVLYWTGGHPYLTQRLCRALAESVNNPTADDAGRPPPLSLGEAETPPPISVPEAATEESPDVPVPPIIPTSRTVDDLAHKLFLSRQARERDDNLIFVRERLLRSEQDVPSLLYLYRRIWRGQSVADDETNPLITILRLSGIALGHNGYLKVRNRIYQSVFDPAWIQTNMPAAEVRRQRVARRRGVALGLSIALVLLLGYLFVRPVVTRYREIALSRGTAQKLETAYRDLISYRDTFDTTVEIGVGGTMVATKGSGSILFNRPDMVRLEFESDFSSPATTVKLISDGKITSVHAPDLKQFRVDLFQALRPFELPHGLGRQVGPMRLLPVYRLFLATNSLGRFFDDAHNIQYAGTADLDGKKVRVLTWEHSAETLLGPGFPGFHERERGRRFPPPLEPPGPPSGEQVGGTPPPTVLPPPPGHRDFMNVFRRAEEMPRIPVTAWIGADNRIAQIRLDFSNWARLLVGSSLLSAPVTGLILTERHRNIQAGPAPIDSKSFVFDPGLLWGSQPVADFDIPEPNLSHRVPVKKELAAMIPHRLPSAPTNLVDLTPYFNASLLQTWHPGLPENSLNALPTGLLQFGDLAFDVRGVVQVSGKSLEQAGGKFPRKLVGIQLNQSCRVLQFLQATGWRENDGTKVGSYILHYADGEVVAIPLIYGEDLRDWNADADPSAQLKRASIVWSAINNGNRRVRIFKMAWENPRPDKELTTMDFESAMSEAAPFLLAITAEK